MLLVTAPATIVDGTVREVTTALAVADSFLPLALIAFAGPRCNDAVSNKKKKTNR